MKKNQYLPLVFLLFFILSPALRYNTGELFHLIGNTIQSTAQQQWAAEHSRKNSQTWWNQMVLSYSEVPHIWSGSMSQGCKSSPVLHPLVVMHWIKLNDKYAKKVLKSIKKGFFNWAEIIVCLMILISMGWVLDTYSYHLDPLETPVLIAILARTLTHNRENVKTSEITKTAQSSQFL